jgi:hypothetical protein
MGVDQFRRDVDDLEPERLCFIEDAFTTDGM